MLNSGSLGFNNNNSSSSIYYPDNNNNNLGFTAYHNYHDPESLYNNATSHHSLSNLNFSQSSHQPFSHSLPPQHPPSQLPLTSPPLPEPPSPPQDVPQVLPRDRSVSDRFFAGAEPTPDPRAEE
ncbi:hypothetical protein JCM5350_003016, partial [Sporobolomyces pararoseus]